MKEQVKNGLIVAALIGLAVVSRVVLHVPNFAALGAVGLFSGFYFRSKFAVFVPLIAVFISDCFVGFYGAGTMTFVYAAWMLPVFIGRMAKNAGNHHWIGRVGALGLQTLGTSLCFYLISNLGVWIFSGMYAKTAAGLLECYTLAIPFVRMSLLSDLFFTTMIFGVYYAAQAIAVERKNALAK